jgi:hypothetical protein
MKATAGTKIAELPDKFANYEWDLSGSIIPVDYDFTQIDMGGVTVETIENATITQLDKTKSSDSGSVDPSTITLATLLPGDANMIVKILASLGQTVPDCFKCLFALGKYVSTSAGVRTYNVYRESCVLVIQDGQKTGQALQRFTGSLQLKEQHLPVMNEETNGATLTWTESTGAIAYVAG